MYVCMYMCVNVHVVMVRAYLYEHLKTWTHSLTFVHSLTCTHIQNTQTHTHTHTNTYLPVSKSSARSSKPSTALSTCIGQNINSLKSNPTGVVKISREGGGMTSGMLLQVRVRVRESYAVSFIWILSAMLTHPHTLTWHAPARESE
jgi:hypothetical protein